MIPVRLPWSMPGRTQGCWRAELCEAGSKRSEAHPPGLAVARPSKTRRPGVSKPNR